MDRRGLGSVFARWISSPSGQCDRHTRSSFSYSGVKGSLAIDVLSNNVCRLTFCSGTALGTGIAKSIGLGTIGI